MSDLTGPESNCERRIAGVERKEMLKDACRWCLNRQPYFDVIGCKEPGRTYPTCTKDDRAPAFDPDLAEIERRRAA